MATALRQDLSISVEEFLSGEAVANERHEYLNGEVFPMAGATQRHNAIVLRLGSLLDQQLNGKPCRPFGSDMLVKVERGTDLHFYYPDASVICRPAGDEAVFQECPTVVFEVLSPSTRRNDKGEKWHAYLSIPSLEAYVLIDTEKVEVTVWKRVAEKWEPLVYLEREDVVELECIGCRLAVGDLYARASL